MNTQELLTFLFDTLFLGFITIAVFDFSIQAITLYKDILNTPAKISINSQPQQLPQSSNPMLLATEQLKTIASSSQSAQKPPLALALAKAAGEGRSRRQPSANKSTIDDDLWNLNVDELKLRPARKIAKLLGIAQKVNGKDQKLSFLRSQIKLKFQQTRSLSPEVVIAVKTELVAC